VSDHTHYEYAEARHDHRGEYAPDRHDHDLDYAEKHHRHYDDERTVEELRGQIRELRAIMIEFGLELSEAQGRIHQLEQQAPQARQLEYEADLAAAGDDDENDDLVTCTRTVWTDGNPEPCGLPVDHDPDEKCPGSPHARPAPEASQP
jgi:hypothetical protein